MYSLFDYGQMIADTGRMTANVQALKQAIKPGSVVLDVGAGTGIFSMLACQMGASKVYAIEPDEAAVQLGQAIAKANGYADTIEFIQNFSTEVNLPERVDVVISDMRGILPLYQQHLPAIQDVRKRFLKPEGILIPQCDRIWATIIAAPELDQSLSSPWNDQPFGFDLTLANSFITNQLRNVNAKVEPKMFLVEPQLWTTLNYLTIAESSFSSELCWHATKSGLASGLCLWFDTTLFDKIGFSNEPGQPALIYGQGFFPFSKPTEIAPGDRINVNIKANLVGDDYVWSWQTQVFRNDDQAQPIVSYKQSSFLGLPRSPIQMRKRSERHIVRLNRKGEMDYWILSEIQKHCSLGELAIRLIEQFPDRFLTQKAALTYLGSLSLKYSD
jgi:type I protein arginine methyltransferase